MENLYNILQILTVLSATIYIICCFFEIRENNKRRITLEERIKRLNIIKQKMNELDNALDQRNKEIKKKSIRQKKHKIALRKHNIQISGNWQR